MRPIKRDGISNNNFALNTYDFFGRRIAVETSSGPG